MTPLHALCVVLIAPPFLAGAYYWLLVAIALGRRPRVLAQIAPPKIRFDIVIPAHDEASGIDAALRSCAALDYPPHLFRIVVIADNCTDDTAIIARRSGAIVLERRDPALRGKGHALAWALPQVMAGRPDAVVLLDADCTLDPTALQMFARRLAAGQRVLQARVATANPDVSPVSYAAAVGNLLENDLFYAPKDRLGGVVFLRGTGMAFAADLLTAHPWAAYSLAEDSEYTITLLRGGIRVRWVGEVTVRSDAPTDVLQLNVQRRRWAAALNDGTTGCPSVGPSVVQSSTHLIRLLDARLTRLVLSRPLVLGTALLAVVVSAGRYWWDPNPTTAFLAITGTATFALHVGYLLLGVVLLGVTPRRLRLLATTPIVVVRLFWIALRGLAGAGPPAWVRTPRPVEPTAERAA